MRSEDEKVAGALLMHIYAPAVVCYSRQPALLTR